VGRAKWQRQALTALKKIKTLKNSIPLFSKFLSRLCSGKMGIFALKKRDKKIAKIQKGQNTCKQR
jgi:hypothetical protein